VRSPEDNTFSTIITSEDVLECALTYGKLHIHRRMPRLLRGLGHSTVPPLWMLCSGGDTST